MDRYFRPLSGNYISQYDITSEYYKTCKWISVPCRGTTFLNADSDYVEIDEAEVSVPCRGTTFLNTISHQSTTKPASGFPSPVGELHFSININELFKYPTLFPSPVGELHFSMENIMIKKYWKICFRPLSGNYISQYSRNVS